MRAKLRKRVKRALDFYKINFQYPDRVKVLIDTSFVEASLKNHKEIVEAVERTLSLKLSSAKPYVTSCVIRELQKIRGGFLAVKEFNKVKCAHRENPADPTSKKLVLSGSECVFQAVRAGNPSRYCVASQNRALQRRLRTHTVGVPRLYWNCTRVEVERPSDKEREWLLQASEAKQRMAAAEKQQLLQTAEKDAQLLQRRKKKRGCNPLACLPPKKRKAEQQQQPAAKRTRSHRRRKNSSGCTVAATSVADDSKAAASSGV